MLFRVPVPGAGGHGGGANCVDLVYHTMYCSVLGLAAPGLRSVGNSLSNFCTVPVVVWRSVVRCGVVWCCVVCGVVWRGVVRCYVVWCGVVWCGVAWCGVVWCGVVWCVVWCCGVV